MDLSRNKLSGNIPNQIGQMVALEVLDLSSNQLNGTVPKEIGQCLGLQSVKLNNNSLSGSLPGSIGNLIHSVAGMRSLSIFDVSFNNLEGSVPQGIHNVSLVWFLHNRGLCGELVGLQSCHSNPCEPYLQRQPRAL